LAAVFVPLGDRFCRAVSSPVVMPHAAGEKEFTVRFFVMVVTVISRKVGQALTDSPTFGNQGPSINVPTPYHSQ
jgi:hypothetical protein